MICASKHYFINRVNDQIHPVLYATSWKMSNNFWWNVQHNNNYSLQHELRNYCGQNNRRRLCIKWILTSEDCGDIIYDFIKSSASFL